MNTILRSVVTLALVLPLAFAQARPGSTGSFKGGFSSQKASPTSIKPQGSRMGGFGAAKAPADSPRQSAMTRDLDQKAAQQRALGTLDARRAAANPLPPAAPSTPAPAPQRPPVIVHETRGGSGWGGALFGFMLGSALSSHATAAPQVVHENTSGMITPAAVPASAAAVPAPVPAPAPAPGSVLLPLLLWGLLLAAVAAVVLKYRRMKAARVSHYSLEGN
ncbi:hypothetical protein [Massilia sp. TS11]|uniref:hypothetical protein n=1 Tax=Massilia sp. TS11 TaxID=2908003 RepID=UPI001EDB06BE|nr:hypothetical protein [Massilia sp. TS11]MCG2585197.1 hypothetical protein [Massilia sp. TS11]